MKKSVKIIIALAAVIVIAASVLTVSLIDKANKDAESTKPGYSRQSTTAPSVVVVPDTEAWVNMDQIANDLATATESDTSTDTTVTESVSASVTHVIVSYIYITGDEPTTQNSGGNGNTQNGNSNNNKEPEFSEYKYSVNEETSEVTLTKYYGTSTSLVEVPNEINGNPVTAIADKCFLGKKMTSVILGENIKNIGSKAFKDCTKLKSFTYKGVPHAVVMGDDVFEGCTSLAYIGLPPVDSMGSGVFRSCTSLEEITITDGTKAMGSEIFQFCTSLKTVTIPESVETIGTGIFSGAGKDGDSSNIVVKCVEGSVAHTKATQYNAKIEFITE